MKMLVVDVFGEVTHLSAEAVYHVQQDMGLVVEQFVPKGDDNL
ncbi:MAG: hypothetical protein WB502_07595 [Thermoactinomyces sp.]